MNARLLLARRRAGLHPAYVRAAESKLDTPPEIYAYPAMARRGAEKPSSLPKAPMAIEPLPSLRWLPAVYAALGLVLWVVAATVPGV